MKIKSPCKSEPKLAALPPELAAEWDFEKNLPLDPASLSPNSHKKVWWKCRTCGYEWQAVVKSRGGDQRCGCPACANKVVVPGFNDFASAHPELVSQWHPTRNGALAPCDITPGSKLRVWWQCPEGHEWQATVGARSRGTGCPVCSGKIPTPGVNDFASVYPGLAAEWDHEKNGGLEPSAVMPQSNRSVWWKCSLGHSFKSRVATRASHGSGCPYCTNRKVLPGFNDLETREPLIAAQWHPTRNGALAPCDVTPGSKRRVWWQCLEGHEWQAVVYSRAGAQKCGCPVCSGKIKPRRQSAYRAIAGSSSYIRR